MLGVRIGHVAPQVGGPVDIRLVGVILLEFHDQELLIDFRMRLGFLLLLFLFGVFQSIKFDQVFPLFGKDFLPIQFLKRLGQDHDVISIFLGLCQRVILER